MVYFDSERQSPEEPRIRPAITQQSIGNQPSLGSFLKGL